VSAAYSNIYYIHCGLQLYNNLKAAVFCQDCDSGSICCVKNDAVPAEVNGTWSHVQPHDLAQ